MEELVEENIARVKISLTLPCLADEHYGNDSLDSPREGSLNECSKKKKKKKTKGGTQSPKKILAFNTSELMKLDEQKAEMKNKSMKSLTKCASFPGRSSESQVPKASRESEDLSKQADDASSLDVHLPFLRCMSLPLKSAFRGGYEEMGLGPRPKLQVKWAPTVLEPPASSISHTVNSSHSKKKDVECNKQSSKFHSTDSHRQGRKKGHKSKNKKVASRYSCGSDSDLDKNLDFEELGNEVSAMPSEIESDDRTMVTVGSDEATTVMEHPAVDDLWFHLDSKCGASYRGTHIACKFLCEHAM